MGLEGIISLAVSSLGLSKDLAILIKNKLAKKITVTPHSITTTARQWDSTNSVIVQNNTDKPLFSVQIVLWREKHQQLKFKLEKVNKESSIGTIFINYGAVIYSAEVANGERLEILELLRLMPHESVEVDLQIEKKGTIKIFPVSYDSKNSKQVLNQESQFAYPFRPPFNMKLHSVSLFLKTKN